MHPQKKRSRWDNNAHAHFLKTLMMQCTCFRVLSSLFFCHASLLTVIKNQRGIWGRDYQASPDQTPHCDHGVECIVIYMLVFVCTGMHEFFCTVTCCVIVCFTIFSVASYP